MTVSMRVMSAGNGYQYLLRSVVAGDGKRSLTTPMTRYYSEVGTPPGRWMGTGLRGFGSGQILPGMQVAEAQLALLVGMGRDPMTGETLGRAYPVYKPLSDRIKDRVGDLDPEMTVEDCVAETSRIEAEETVAGAKRAVAGYDLTFSVPKSVSVLWGASDAATQVRILDAHHDALADVLAYLEREVARTRTGVSSYNGAVAQVDVAGVAATAYDHWDSRSGDPQLHTHLVVSNKVQTLLDGHWRSLDGRPMHAAVTALSAHYNSVLADRLSSELGVEWELRNRGEDRNPQWEIAGVTDELITEFSGRTRAIEQEKERLIDEYSVQHGHRPSNRQMVQLRATATLATRPEKTIHSLADLTEDWRERTSRIVGGDATQWATSLTSGPAPMPLRAEEVALAAMNEMGAEVVRAVSVKRSTWRHWNLWAEASRQTMDLRFETVADREAIVGLIVGAAERQSIALTPSELAITPLDFRRQDGSSVFRPHHSTVLSSIAVLDAEARILARAEDRTAPRVEAQVVEKIAAREVAGQKLSPQQVAALGSIATSGRRVDLLVGPAGAGKTTAMRALRSAWIVAHGKDGVVGLAPSAAAAQVLAEDLGVACDNTAKWLSDYCRGTACFQADQLVILDEATLAGTTVLDRITALAVAAGAKVLLVGDWAQLQSVDAGGAFSLLAFRRTDAPELTEIHRFTHEWEKDASLGLRDGQIEVISIYARNERVQEGNTDDMLDAAYAAWLADTKDGKESVLVTEATESVHALNARARAERILDGDTHDGQDVQIADGARASVGDVVITRRNDRRLRTRRGGWVRNGDRWTVTDVRADGSLVVTRQERRWASTVVLPPEYVALHVDLGYAVTAHRAQGMTVGTAHVVVSGKTTRENFYVSMTRGRDSNIAYVALDQPDDSHATPEPDEVTARSVLYGVLRHSGAELSAHQTVEAEQEQWSSIAQIGAEYETVGAAAQHDRFVDLLRQSGLRSDQVADVISSDAFGPLTAALRRAEAFQHDLERLMPQIVTQHSLHDAEDIAAVLHSRLTLSTGSAPRGDNRPPRLIAGLIPEALGPMDPESREALEQRKQLIETRARALAERDVDSKAGWVRRLGEPPTDRRERRRWLTCIETVAAYRDRYAVEGDLPLGPRFASEARQADRIRASLAAKRATLIAGQATPAEINRSASVDTRSL